MKMRVCGHSALVLGLTLALLGTALSPASVPRETRVLTVLMYHSLLRDPARTGVYVLPPEELKKDILWLQANGYTVVSAAETAAFVREGGPLPEKPVILTFDDGYVNNALYALPILEETDTCAVFSVVGAFTGRFTAYGDQNPNYAHLDWAGIQALAASPRAEIGNHTYHLHDTRLGAGQVSGESDSRYLASFSGDVEALQQALEEKCGFRPVIFTYPFGIFSEKTRPVLASLGLEISFSCREVHNTITPGEDCLFALGRYNRSGLESREAFFRRVFPSA